MRTGTLTKTKLNISVGEEINEKLILLATIKGVSKAQVIRDMVNDYTERNKEAIATYLENKARADEALKQMD